MLQLNNVELSLNYLEWKVIFNIYYNAIVIIIIITIILLSVSFEM